MSQPTPNAQPLSALQSLEQQHQAIQQHLERLGQFTHTVAEGQITLQLTTEGVALQRFFTREMIKHQQDEERVLFPQLQRQSLKLADRVHRALQQHQQIGLIWQQISPQLPRPNTIASTTEFSQLVEQFCSLVADHLATEQEELFDLAQHIFSQKELEKMGQTMQEQGLARPQLRIS